MFVHFPGLLQTAAIMTVTGAVTTPLSLGFIWMGKKVKTLKDDDFDPHPLTKRISRLAGKCLKGVGLAIRSTSMMFIGFIGFIGTCGSSTRLGFLSNFAFSLIFIHGLMEVNYKYGKKLGENPANG